MNGKMTMPWRLPARQLSMLWPHLPWVLLLLAGSWPLLSPGYFASHENAAYPERAYELFRILGSAPLSWRWAPDWMQGRGLPFFNFYPPLSYLLIAAFHLLGLSFDAAAKAVVVLAGAALGYGTQRLVARHADRAVAGAAAALAVSCRYFWTDVYVRGDLAEALGMGLLPLVLLAADQIYASSARRAVGLLALGLAGLFLSHNVMALAGAPTAVAWALIVAAPKARAPLRSVAARLGASSVLGLAASAFFWAPAWVEKSLVHIEAIKFYSPTTEGLSLAELLGWPTKRPGLVPSLGLAAEGMLALSAAILLWRRRGSLASPGAKALLLGLAWAAMTLGALSVHYGELPLLEFIQFPWRFLAQTSVLLAVSASLLGELPARGRPWLAAGLVALAVAGIATAPKPSGLLPASALSAEIIERSGSGGGSGRCVLHEWVPRSGAEEPRRPDSALGIRPRVQEQDKGPGFASAQVEASSDEEPFSFWLYDFPGWEVSVDGRPTRKITGPGGLLGVLVPRGVHRVQARFGGTPLRTASELASLLAFVMVGLLLAPRTTVARAS